jgi:hypothetical protein
MRRFQSNRARLATLAICAFVTASLVEPTAARAGDPEPPPPGMRLGLVIGGSVVLALGHITPIAIAARYDFRNAGGWFGAPLVGPWAYLGTRKGCGSGDDSFTGATCSFGNTMLIMVVVTDGLMQIGGAAMLVAGLVSTGKRDAKPARVNLRPTAITIRDGGFIPGIAGSF